MPLSDQSSPSLEDQLLVAVWQRQRAAPAHAPFSIETSAALTMHSVTDVARTLRALADSAAIELEFDSADRPVEARLAAGRDRAESLAPRVVWYWAALHDLHPPKV